MLWYIRESSVAVWVTNLPLIWPLLRDTFPMLRSFTPGQKPYSGSRSKGQTYTVGKSTAAGVAGATGNGDKTKTNVSVMDRGFQLDTLRKKRGDSSISLDSDERQLNGAYFAGLGGINTETTVRVEEHNIRAMEEGDVEHMNEWDRGDEDDNNYRVQIRGGDGYADGAASLSSETGPVEPHTQLEGGRMV
jgi:hypothetical protein